MSSGTLLRVPRFRRRRLYSGRSWRNGCRIRCLNCGVPPRMWKQQSMRALPQRRLPNYATSL